MRDHTKEVQACRFLKIFLGLKIRRVRVINPGELIICIHQAWPVKIFLLSKCLMRIELLGALPKPHGPVLLEQHLAPTVPYHLWPVNGLHKFWVRSMLGAATLYMESCVLCKRAGRSKLDFIFVFVYRCIKTSWRGNKQLKSVVTSAGELGTGFNRNGKETLHCIFLSVFSFFALHVHRF